MTCPSLTPVLKKIVVHEHQGVMIVVHVRVLIALPLVAHVALWAVTIHPRMAVINLMSWVLMPTNLPLNESARLVRQ
jgi:hypothetical protein